MSDQPEQQDHSPHPGYAGPPPTQYPPAPQPVDPYPPGGQPWGYPPGYPMGYPAMPYPGFGPVAPGERRPGTITAAAVLGYVNAGLLILMGIVLFSTSSIVDGLNRYDDYAHDGLSGEFRLDAILNLLAAGLLIGGGVAMTSQTAVGRIIYSVGAAITVGESTYWIARWGSEGGGTYINFWALLYAAMAIVGVCLAWFGGGSAWLHRAPARTS